ncbi:MAG: iron complex outermembrane receptor protein, partial [Pirellulaceae bacterium]
NDAEPFIEEDEDDFDKLLNLDIDQLSRQSLAPALQQIVSSVSRQESTVARSPAAVFVITQEMIRRSGYRSVPELLRMAPGVQVAHIDANKWAISIRGFNNRFSNKLLVQIDGRSVYTPLYGGVFWDVQDLMLEDIERIEVIRGPGATVWGSNAVNGVINVITKSSYDTVGLLFNGGSGKEQNGFVSGRAGGRVSSDFHWRVYSKYLDHDDYFSQSGIQDGYRQSRAGFRAEWDPTCCDSVTFQGDIYDGASGQQIATPTPTLPFFQVANSADVVRGGNALIRWRHQIGDESEIAIQTYFDRTERDSFTRSEDRNTFDVDFQHRFRLNDYHRVIYGAGYRTSEDQLVNDGFVIDIMPAQRTINVVSYFLQDEIELVDDELFFTVGSKFEHNSFTNFEFQPSGRVVWNPNQREAYWAAVSRAVRSPTRIDDDLFIRTIGGLSVVGNRNFESEDLLAYEVGYRAQPHEQLSFDIAGFYHQLNDISGAVPISMSQFQLTNAGDGHAYGFELSANYQINPCWKLFGSYSFQRIDIQTMPNAIHAQSPEGSTPHNQFYFWLSGQLREDVELDLMLRYADSLESMNIPSYVELDARIGWQVTCDLELAVIGRNLLDNHHPEFGDTPFTGSQSTEVERSVFGMATWRY